METNALDYTENLVYISDLLEEIVELLAQSSVILLFVLGCGCAVFVLYLLFRCIKRFI